MRVYIDAKSLLDVVTEKNVGLYDIARLAEMSPTTISNIFKGKPILLKTASRLFNALDKDRRLQIWYDAPQSSNQKGRYND